MNLSLIFNIFMLSQTSPKNYGKLVNSDTVKQVHILFRHGDRYNDENSIKFTSDINDVSKFFTGELTPIGKRKMYRIGKMLRHRYNFFLNDYNSKLLEARSSGIHRTKQSLLLVLAGLFPPKLDDFSNLGINWQPIPYDYKEISNDPEFFGIGCREYMNIFKSYLSSKMYYDNRWQFNELFNYISINTNKTVNSILDVYIKYLALKTELETKHILPTWAKPIYPSPMKEAASKVYEDFVATRKMSQYASGFMLKKILDDGKLMMEDPSHAKKFILLSGHDINCAMLLTILGVFKFGIPPYGAYVTLELHKINGVYGYAISYQNFTTRNPHILHIPNCGTFCPYKKFYAMYKKYLPTDDMKCNEDII